MRRQHRVLWSKGMFLMPQHFQAQDSFVREQIHFRSSLTSVANWGVSALEIDEDGIANGTFRLLRAAGVLPDGLAFSFPESDASPLSRSFEEAFAPELRSLDVFVGVPESQSGGQNVAYPGGPVLRYTARDQKIYDEIDGLEDTIEVAQPNFQILFGDEPLAGMTAIRFARLVRGKGGAYELDPEYIPPCLNAACSSFLWERSLGALLSRMVFVSEQLSRERGQRSEQLADFGDSDIRRFWVLHLVNTAIPELKHIYGIRHCPPEDLYRFLVRIGGSLCTFSEEYRAADFPAYDHLNLGQCLPVITAQIERMLRTMVYRRRRCQSVALDVVEARRHFRAPLTRELIERGAFYLAVKKDPAVSVLEIEASLKVVGRSTLDGVATLAGLQLSHETQAPADCARREERIWFRVVTPSNQSFVSPAHTGYGVAGRSGSRQEQERNVAFRRVEVWQDIQDNSDLRLVVLKPEHVPLAELFVVLPDAQGSAILA